MKRKLGFRSMMLDRVEEQISKLLIEPSDDAHYDDASYKAVPNDGFNTALVSLYRDVIELRQLAGTPAITGNPQEDLKSLRLVTKIPSISILPGSGARVENATVTAQSRLELGTTRIFWPILIRLVLVQGTGAKYDDARKQYTDSGKPLPLTDQWVLAWDDLDGLLNAHTLGIVNVANKASDSRFPVSMTDALITECEPMLGTGGAAAPFEIMDYTLLIMLNQDKSPGQPRRTANPPTISGLKR